MVSFNGQTIKVVNASKRIAELELEVIKLKNRNKFLKSYYKKRINEGLKMIDLTIEQLTK